MLWCCAVVCRRADERKPMKNSDILETDLAMELISIIVDKALKKYKIDQEGAARIVIEIMEEHPKFLQWLETGPTLKRVLKSRIYDDVATNARRKIYYELRQYKQNLETRESLIDALKQIPHQAPETGYRDILTQLCLSHISTKERYPAVESFYSELFHHIGQPTSIVDVGCGMHPLLFPFKNEGRNVAHYTALDKDRTSISAVDAFSRVLGGDILHAVNWDIKDNWRVVRDITGIDVFDTAFLLKLVPVVYRIERRLVEILLDTPARVWVITGSMTSMTKYVNIEKRERKFINRFIRLSGKKIVGEFAAGNEFCIVVD